MVIAFSPQMFAAKIAEDSVITIDIPLGILINELDNFES